MHYDKQKVKQLLTSEVITGLLRIYGLTLNHIAFRLNITKQGFLYKLRTGTIHDYEKDIIYDYFKQLGCEDTFIVLLNTMLNQQRK